MEAAQWLGIGGGYVALGGVTVRALRALRPKVRVFVRKVYGLDAQGSKSWSAVVQVENRQTHAITVEQVFLEIYDGKEAKMVSLPGPERIAAGDTATYEVQGLELEQRGAEWPTSKPVIGTARVAPGRVYHSGKRKLD